MNLDVRPVATPGLWTLHSYYSLCPWAPDGSGRLLLAGGDPQTGQGEVLVLSSDGKIVKRIGPAPLTESFWHTGFWQTWGPGGTTVYYQAGTMRDPVIVRHDLASGTEERMPGGMDGSPPHGEPILSGLLGMLYAAGYGTCVYDASMFPVPIRARDRHGLFAYTLRPRSERLALSVQETLAAHPDRERIAEADEQMRKRLGPDEGLTLMLYCLRWNRQGTRCLFYFGNHCVVKDRQEPRLSYVMTADRELKDIRLALDLSFGRSGVHWSWQPDGERLIGYGPDPRDPTRRCLAEVRYDGSGYRQLSDHASGGHPSICPADQRLAVTDEGGIPGRVVFLDVEDGREVAAVSPGRVYGDREPPGRNPFRVCHHPVFSPDGRTVLVNTINGPHAQVAVIDATPVLELMARKASA